MAQSSPSSKFVVVGAIAALGVLVGVLWLTKDQWAATSGDTPNKRDTVLPLRRESDVRFVDVAKEKGADFRMNYIPTEQGETFKTNLYDHGSGVAVADIDGDGDDDVLFLNQLGANGLYANQGDGSFVEITDQSPDIALDDRICVAAAFGDYDNDGDPDLYITSARGGNALFENQGKGVFKDVTEFAGVGCVKHSQGATFLDFDSDGDLDLFVANTAEWTNDPYNTTLKYYPGVVDLWQMASCVKEENMLYRNNGDGTFTDVAEQAGLKGLGWTSDLAAADVDGDGDLDVYLTNMFGRSQLYHNDGTGVFTDVTLSVLGHTSFGAMGAKFLDVDNDGLLDLYVVSMHSDMWMRPGGDWDLQEQIERQEAIRFEKILGPKFDVEQEDTIVQVLNVKYDEVVFGNTFYKNLGNGKFEERSQEAGLEVFWPWGIAPGDFDNDGYQDIFIPSGMGHPYFHWRNALLMNNGDGTFVERSRKAGIDPPPGGPYRKERIEGRPVAHSSRSAACADFDEDGRVDIMVNNFNGVAYYHHNETPQRNYAKFLLQGTKSNRDAVGATITIHIGDEIMVRQVPFAGGFFSQASKVMHFGLGDRTAIDRAEIHWPSGIHQTIEKPAINTKNLIVEPQE